jgi:para-nitrobenzyl esterase
MTGLATVIIVASIASAGAGARAEDVRLHVGGLGDVVGTRNAGGIVDEFRGIPFAYPPIGKLRWRPPIPIRPWTGVRAHAHMLFDVA